MQQVRGKTAFITGGGSGIGLGIARTLAGAGMRVVIADLRPDHIEQAMAGFAEAGQGDQVAAMVLDVTDREGFVRAADEAERRFGKVHVLVNNAGVGINGPVLSSTFADWDFGLGVNLGGAVNGLVTFLPRIRAHGEGGHVVFVASQAGITPAPRNAAIYGAAKAALVAMAESMREELGEVGIGVSVLLAGYFRTNIHEAERNRPERFRQGSGYGAPVQVPLGPQDSPLWRDPLEAGQSVLDGILADALYVPTHGELKGWAEGRFEAILAAYPPVRDPRLARAMGRRRQADPFGVKLGDD